MATTEAVYKLPKQILVLRQQQQNMIKNHQTGDDCWFDF